MHGSDEFFAVTKAVHNALQGADIEWTPAMQRIYLEKVLDNALLLDGDCDFVVVHDPQPAAMLSFLRESARADARTTHVDLALPHRPHRRQPRRCGSSSARSSSCTTRRCGRCPSSCPRRSTMDHVVHAPPCIDPLSVKNLELAMPFCQELTPPVRRRRRTGRSCAR